MQTSTASKRRSRIINFDSSPEPETTKSVPTTPIKRGRGRPRGGRVRGRGRSATGVEHISRVLTPGRHLSNSSSDSNNSPIPNLPTTSTATNIPTSTATNKHRHPLSDSSPETQASATSTVNRRQPMTNAERMRNYRERQSAIREQQRRKQDANCHRQQRSQQSPGRAQHISGQNAERHRQQRSQQSPGRAHRISQQDAEHHRQQRSQQSPGRAQHILQQNAERHRQQRSQQSPGRAHRISQQDAEHHRQQRSQQSPGRAQHILQQNAERHRQQRSQQSPDRAQHILQQNAERHRQQRSQQSPGRAHRISQQDAEHHRQQRSQQSPGRAQHILQQNAERHRQQRSQQSPDRAQHILQQNAERHRQQRSQQSPGRAHRISQQDAEHHRQQRSQQSPGRAQHILQQNAERHRQQRSQQSPDRAQHISQQNAERHRQQRQQQAVNNAQTLHQRYEDFIAVNVNIAVTDSPRFGENLIDEHMCGEFNIKCQHCGALHFEDERPRDGLFTRCCRKGRLRLPEPLLPYPVFLRNPLTSPNNPDYTSYRLLIRNYNSSMSFVSLGANITTPPGRGPFCFQINGMTHHRMESLDVPDGQDRQYAQLYFLDSATQANEARMNHPANSNFNPILLRQITDYFRQNNHYADIFRSTHELLLEAEARGENTENVQLVFNREYQMPGIHPGRQNQNVAENEVAAVFVLENEGVPNFDRDFAVYVKDGVNQADERRHIQIHPQSPHIDPMTYPLLFPHGEPGWNINWQCIPYVPLRLNQIPHRITLLQYKTALLQVREQPWRPILHAGRLTQQFIVDSYLQVESNNLNWIRMNQDAIRANNYTALNNFVARRAERQGIDAVPSIILPSSFQGSNRYMRQLCQDAMAIFGRFGKPDLFITFTCNPLWQDITANLLPGETPSDRPDIVSRVFHIKLSTLLDEIKGGLLGPVVCYVYTIEFQKRGLPHAHILVTLQNGFKPVDAESIDKIVCAELPDRAENPRLFAIVTRSMIHGPCREGLCIVNGKCSKQFPKRCENETVIVPNNYSRYRRRNFPPQTVIDGRNQEKQVSNQYVVAFCPYLTLKYNAHINVEVITGCSGSAVKYIYKYVFKGFDVASLKFTRNGELICDEVKNFISCRYVSAPEAMWRLFEFQMHDRSHAITRLPIHLENPSELEFDGGLEIEPEREAIRANTMLDAYFELNSRDPQARQYLYTEIPPHYVFNAAQRRWNPRQQRGDRMIARIHDVSPHNQEVFALRMLLLNVRGATSFTNIRKVNDQEYDTFREAAQAWNLVRNDDGFFQTMDDLRVLNMPEQLRQTFIIMLLTYTITSAMAFWLRYRDDMIEDFRRLPQFRDSDNDMLYNMALHAINRSFSESGKSCRTFGLPMPQGDAPNIAPEQNPATQPPQVFALNQAQQHGFDQIMGAARAVRNNQQHQRIFVLIGPGGSGKTTLYRQIINACQQEHLIARVYATTGIAATLMPEGLTAHRGFGLPLKMHAQSRSYFEHNLDSVQCAELRATDVILIDEITMMVKHGIRIIDTLLQNIMHTNSSFGGKVIVFGGDFRQLLPVVPRGSRAEIIAESVLGNNQWRHFEVITLTQNMRAQGDPQFVEWLLKLGTGSLPTTIAGDPNMVEIPQDMLLEIPAQPPQVAEADNISIELQTLIRRVFGDDLNTLTRQQIITRAILTANLKNVMNINNFMIASLNGQEMRYLSLDEIISDDDNDALNFPVEYLNAQQPSGIPPHELILKIGTVVMLLRNLDPKKGLSNGTRLIVTQLLQHAIVADIISDSHQGETVFIFRMDLVSEDAVMPVKMRRQQFPLIPAFVMTINKSQGQTIENVGIYLNDVVFSHGQLYVALSRSRDRRNITVLIKDQGSRQGRLMKDIAGSEHRVFTRNVVFREVFQHGELEMTILPNIDEIEPELT